MAGFGSETQEENISNNLPANPNASEDVEAKKLEQS
jgi:hypothetical protein